MIHFIQHQVIMNHTLPYNCLPVVSRILWCSRYGSEQIALSSRFHATKNHMCAEASISGHQQDRAHAACNPMQGQDLAHGTPNGEPRGPKSRQLHHTVDTWCNPLSLLDLQDNQEGEGVQRAMLPPHTRNGPFSILVGRLEFLEGLP